MKLLLPVLLLATAHAEPLKLLVIGDSQSEEYRFEVPFSAPDSDPFQSNTQNWIEILNILRPTEISFGSYKNDLGSYLDLRNGGFYYNWGVPAAEIETWTQIISSGPIENLLYFVSTNELRGQLKEVDAVVIFLGGNDANSVYFELADDNPPPSWAYSIVSNLGTLVSFIDQQNPDLPIILSNIPDVGATPRTQVRIPEPERRAIARGHIQEANAAIEGFASTLDIPLFDTFALTRELDSPAPYRIGNIEFIPRGDPENRPRYLLCKDGFHPSTPAQAQLANLIINALNQAADFSLTPLSDTEILTHLGIPADQDDPYLAWVANFLLANDSLFADPDRDGLPTLGEYALNLTPRQHDTLPITQKGIWEFLPARTDYVTTSASSSTDLKTWTPLDPNEITSLPDGRKRIESTAPFTRLDFTINPQTVAP
ncbi:MAG: GDSL-type esterase/lipase family protein [Verrucomicrobiaceae bacterium]